MAWLRHNLIQSVKSVFTQLTGTFICFNTGLNVDCKTGMTCLLTRSAAMLRIKLHVFVARFTLALSLLQFFHTFITFTKNSSEIQYFLRLFTIHLSMDFRIMKKILFELRLTRYFCIRKKSYKTKPAKNETLWIRNREFKKTSGQQKLSWVKEINHSFSNSRFLLATRAWCS